MARSRPNWILPRRGILGLLAGAALVGIRPVEATAEIVSRIETYLSGITTLRARFDQIAHSGELSSGRLYWQRPSRMRLDYDPPSQIKLIAPGDWRLVFVDGSIDQVNVIPVGQTPLSVLLQREIRFEGEVTVTDVARQSGEVGIALVRTEAPDQGSVTLIFGEQPFELRRWSVVDAQGLRTIIILSDIETGVSFESGWFRWQNRRR